MFQNANGLTFTDWLNAAHCSDELGTKTLKLMPAWQDGEDPCEWIPAEKNPIRALPVENRTMGFLDPDDRFEIGDPANF